MPRDRTHLESCDCARTQALEETENIGVHRVRLDALPAAIRRLQREQQMVPMEVAHA
jgi:hypothetical protein